MSLTNHHTDVDYGSKAGFAWLTAYIQALMWHAAKKVDTCLAEVTEWSPYRLAFRMIWLANCGSFQYCFGEQLWCLGCYIATAIALSCSVGTYNYCYLCFFVAVTNCLRIINLEQTTITSGIGFILTGLGVCLRCTNFNEKQTALCG